MLLQQAKPAKALEHWIHSYRQYRFAPGDTVPLVGLPGTGAELWLCDAPQPGQQTVSPGDGVLCPRSHSFELRPGVLRIFSVRFRAGALPFFIDQPLSQLIDRYTPLDALWSEAAAGPLAGLKRSPYFEERCRLAERFLLARLQAGQGLEQMQQLATTMYEQSADFSLSDYAGQLQRDRSHLSRQFHAVQGTSAKYFHRLCRFERFLRDALFSTDASLAGLAVDHGYYDQAHMSNDVRQLTRYSPRALLARKETRVFYSQRLDPGRAARDRSAVQAPKTSSPLR